MGHSGFFEGRVWAHRGGSVHSGELRVWQSRSGSFEGRIEVVGFIGGLSVHSGVVIVRRSVHSRGHLGIVWFIRCRLVHSWGA